MAQVRTRKRGKTYSYIFEAGQVNGKRKVVEKGGFATKDAAYEAGVAAYADWKHGNIGITSEKITFKTFIEQYMQNVVKLNVKASSYANYESRIKNLILPFIGDIAVQDITPAVIDNLIRTHAQNGYAYRTIEGIHALLKQFLDYAVYPAELISSNPVQYIKLPKAAPKNVVKRTIISAENYKKLLILHPMGKPCHIPISLMFYTGMRIGEVLGLCWEDIELNAVPPCIHVRNQYLYIPGIGNVLTPPKTPTSVRDILIDQRLVELLRQWKKRCAEHEVLYGDSYLIVDEQENHVIKVYSKGLATPATNRRKMVCVYDYGRPVGRNTVMYHLKKAGINSHSFRHTHATILAENFAPAKGIAGRLGHKKISITNEVYTHNTPKMQQEVADIFSHTMQTN